MIAVDPNLPFNPNTPATSGVNSGTNNVWQTGFGHWLQTSNYQSWRFTPRTAVIVLAVFIILTSIAAFNSRRATEGWRTMAAEEKEASILRRAFRRK